MLDIITINDLPRRRRFTNLLWRRESIPMNRRLFLNHAFTGAFGGLCLTKSNLMASIAKKRRLSKIGLQLYTVRRELEKDFEGTLAKVAALGFSEVEFAGYFNR